MKMHSQKGRIVNRPVPVRIIGVTMMTLLLCIVSLVISANPCCTPSLPIYTPTPPIVTPPTPLEIPEEPECSMHWIDIGFRATLLNVEDSPEFMETVIFNLNERTRPLGEILDLSGGISFGSIQKETALGLNLRIGYFSDVPGTPFDVFRVSWFPQEINGDFNRIEVRGQIPLVRFPIFDIARLGVYIGGDGTFHYQQGFGDWEILSPLAGVEIDGCGNWFSFRAYIEFHGAFMDLDCNPLKGSILEVGLTAWVF